MGPNAGQRRVRDDLNITHAVRFVCPGSHADTIAQPHVLHSRWLLAILKFFLELPMIPPRILMDVTLLLLQPALLTVFATGRGIRTLSLRVDAIPCL